MPKKFYIVTQFGFADKRTLVGGLRPYRLSEFLKNEGVDVTLITPMAFAGEELVIPTIRLSRLARFLGRIIPPDLSVLWAIKAYFYLKDKMERDAVLFITVPPHGIGLLGYLLKREMPNLFWIADYRDLWTKNPLHSTFFIKKWVNPFLERLFHKKADLIVANTKWDLELNRKLFPTIVEKSIYVRNGVDEIQNVSSNKLVNKLVYAGGTTKGQATSAVASLLKILNQGEAKYSCDFYGEYDDLMEKADGIHYHGVKRPEEIASILPSYKYGVIYLPKGCEEGGRIAQKFYDYLGAGVIPICFRPSIEMLAMMNVYGTGVKIFDDTPPEEIREQIKNAEFVAKKEDLQALLRNFQFKRLHDYLMDNEII